MVTMAVQLGEEEAAELRDFAERIGEDEAVALREAALRGLREYRLEKAIATYQANGDSTAAAAVAGLPRAVFLWEMSERGDVMLQDPSTLAEELGALAAQLGDARLAKAASKSAEPGS
jgi:hypothetical protein